MSKVYDFDLLVFIGRFQPFHNSHYEVIRTALEKSRNVLVLIGSVNQSRSPKNPFTFREREVMIRDCFQGVQSRLFIEPLKDYYQDAVWEKNVQDKVKQVASGLSSASGVSPKIGLIGHMKDESSYYLECFPQWGQVNVPNFEGRSATDIRNLLFAPNSSGVDSLLASALPESCMAFIRAFRQLPQYAQLVEEQEFLVKYRSQFDGYPYPPIFVTVDSVVIHSGHILLIERRANPGKGLLALPGGFLDVKERLLDSAIRELREETRLKIPEPVLRGSIVDQRVFDSPNRSQRGRTITHAFYFQFPSGPLPPVKGGDDARRAKWFSLSDVAAMDGQMYEDHWHIITSYLGDIG